MNIARFTGRGLSGDGLTQRAAEVLEGRERAGRLGTALVRFGRDLAEARKRVAALERENAAIRRRLASVDVGEIGQRAGSDARGWAGPPNAESR